MYSGDPRRLEARQRPASLLSLVQAREDSPVEAFVNGGTYYEWAGDDAATFNQLRQDFHQKIRAKLPDFVIVHGAEYWKHYSRMMGGAFWRPMDRRVVYDFHAYENDWTDWSALRAQITQWQAQNAVAEWSDLERTAAANDD